MVCGPDREIETHTSGTAEENREMVLQIEGKVERVDGRELSYGDFVERYLKGNRPVVLTGLMDGWSACRDWVNQDGRPNLRFFSDHFGKSLVQVADCGRREFTDQKRLEMSVSEFIRWWLELPAGKCTTDLSCNSDSHSLLYLKDWHFVKEHPGHPTYTTPPFFVDDWLNLYLDSHSMHRDTDAPRDEISCSDYRFVYMGAKGTWTPLHADVFRSYSWSANVCGKKLWLLLPPSQYHHVFDRSLKNSVYNVFEEVSETRFPCFKKTVWLECTQEQNEIIFVPSGWYHQVHNLEDTISINHNWFNAYNLSWVWNLLLKDYNEATEYIEDIREICDDFESLCQRNLAANTGMNFYDFFIFITRFVLANLIQFYLLRDEEMISKPSSTDHHLISNLISIRAVASSMTLVKPFADKNPNSCPVENGTTCLDIEKILEEPKFLDFFMVLIMTYKSIEERTHDYEVASSSAYPEDFLNCLKIDCQKLDFIQVLGSKIRHPDDLIRLIDHAILRHNSICSNCNIVLPSDVLDSEPLAVEQQS